MDPQMNQTIQPAPDAVKNLRCEGCGCGALGVVRTIISVETIRDSVPCTCGAQAKEAAHSTTELKSRHVSSVPIELYDHPALPEEWVEEWVERDGGVLEEVVSCRHCAENADRSSCERSVQAGTQRLEAALVCCHCGHEVRLEPTTFWL